jgi:addiction module HigA family antidote
VVGTGVSDGGRQHGEDEGKGKSVENKFHDLNPFEIELEFNASVDALRTPYYNHHMTLPKNRVISHPGKILVEEFMKPLGLSANALALALRVPANRITGIINGQRAVSADTALRLARYFGTSAEMWVNMQAGHDLSKARAEIGKQIAAEVRRKAPSCLPD